ncbi:MAG: energy-coupling factor ABC transporter ATP-binding protein [Lachnospiraceae bacterium]|nr:energy-coupling factor ABC transporter ATP-binding protein [Lachnospiraceae bacterium]
MEILNVKNLKFKYPKAGKNVIDDVSFKVNEGEFVVLCGPTGSGKSTLLKLLKPEISPLGEKQGHVFFKNEETDRDIEDKKVKASRIGYVCQNPKEQAVTDKVWHELAFGLENMGMPQNVMGAGIAEMASYFGIEDWYEKRVDELSGGQLQILNLASVMVMNPDILILDEPTAQLDPIAAAGFLTTLKKLNNDFALTVIIAEHRLEELIPVCDRILMMEDGKLKEDGAPHDILLKIGKESEIFDALPSGYRVYKGLNDISGNGTADDKAIPVTIRDGREYIASFIDKSGDKELKSRIKDNKYIGYKNASSIKDTMAEKHTDIPPALEFKDVSFRYLRELPDALKDLKLTVNAGEIFCILGGNGSGKTTALNAAAGLIKPYEGCIKVFGKKLKEYKNQSLYNKCLSMLPQDVQTLFLHNTVREELEGRKILDRLPDFPFDISMLLDRHPYDLSGGEQQLVALALVLATEPKLLLLDEPTKGLDAYRKKNLAEILKKLKASGITIVTVTHDVEFASMCADRCAMFFKGSIASTGDVHSFFNSNNFYTTYICRISRGICDGPVNVVELSEIFKEGLNL